MLVVYRLFDRERLEKLLTHTFLSCAFLFYIADSNQALSDNNHLCKEAIGVDGAMEMIQRANNIDPKGEYVFSDLMEWKPKVPVDIVHSMEVVYYFRDPKKLILHMKDEWLKPGGSIIMGLDFYKENFACHTWPKDLNTEMTLLSIKEWLDLLKNCHFCDVKSYQTNSTDTFAGTLVLYAKKLKK